MLGVFLLGGTAGRTTLNGEGLQHQDGHSHLLKSTVPNLVTYDPVYAYEIAVIIEDGIDRMYHRDEKVFYYLSVSNEPYEMPAKPEGCDEGIIKGMYCIESEAPGDKGLHVNLLGSGAIMGSVIRAREELKKYGVTSDLWSVTSYNELRRDCLEVDRWNLLNPGEEAKVPYVQQILEGHDGPVIASSDYMKAHLDLLDKWIPRTTISLGTDGYGKSETREALRDYFEVDYRFVTLGALTALMRDGKIELDVVTSAMSDLGIDADKLNPMSI